MTQPTRKQKLDNCYEAYHHTKHGTRPGRKARDGSIPTHPVVPVLDVLELGKGGVQDECCKWLKKHRIFHNPHNCGSGDLVGAGQAVYGIKNSGDIHGILPSGIHFEIECKRGKGGRLSAGQQKRMAEVRATNAVYLVVHGVAELEYLMKGLI